MQNIKVYIVLFLWLVLSSCSNETTVPETEQYIPQPYQLEIPKRFQDMLVPPVIPSDNNLTVEGVALGKKLFFDTILSSDNTQSCATCHDPKKAFTDNSKFSEGVTGALGTRNSMPLFNLAWNYDNRFTWGGEELGLERQALEPVTNPNEMNNKNWIEVTERLQNNSEYPNLFKQAFGSSTIDSIMVAKALSQFQRTLISGNSKFDKYVRGEVFLTEAEGKGLLVFLLEEKGDCFHCHGTRDNPLFTDNKFHNNGLDTAFTDLGLGEVTGDPNDNGKFRTPSIRNLAYTAPYMHDGRFETLEEVIDHYSEGLKISSTIDPLMKSVSKGGVQLTAQEKSDLKAFLLTLSDEEFVNNPNFSN